MPMYRYASRSRLSDSFLAVEFIKNRPLAFINYPSMSVSPDSQTFERLFVDLLRHRSARLLSDDSLTIQIQKSRRTPFNSFSAWPYDKTYHLEIDIAKPPSALALLSRLDRLPPNIFLLACTRLPQERQRSGRDEEVQMAHRTFNRRAP